MSQERIAAECSSDCRCLKLKTFCSRGITCLKCLSSGNQCIRNDGLVKARARSYRGPNKSVTSLTKSKWKPQFNSAVVHRTIQLEKAVTLPKLPSPQGVPLVWADTRQELCEGLPYFRAYQGGIYFRSSTVFGYLLDSFGAERDFIGSHVVISHGYFRAILPLMAKRRTVIAKFGD